MLYYHLKPFIPRPMQIALRRRVALRRLSHNASHWPIDSKACTPPQGWGGWPYAKQFALVLTHDVETALGQEKCRPLMELELRMGFRSSFNFVPERYSVSAELRQDLLDNGFEVGVHGLKHDGKLYQSYGTFKKRAWRINHYLHDWRAVGFRSPSMHHNLEWIRELDIEYDMSTFDTDPFEPQADNVGTIFPFIVGGTDSRRAYVELPYTLPQDFTLFVLLKQVNIDTWKQKLDWLAQHGGMALLNTHPDYMSMSGYKRRQENYPCERYEEFLSYVAMKFKDRFWHALPKEVSRFVASGRAN